jgi:hypothetical protein
MTPFARAVLAYERYKSINSQIDYIRRASVYVLSATAFDALCSQVDQEFLDFGKGLSAGLCFANVGVGVLLGCVNAGGNYLMRKELNEFV